MQEWYLGWEVSSVQWWPHRGVQELIEAVMLSTHTIHA